MGMWNDVEEKLTEAGQILFDAGQDIARQAKVFADNSRLNSQIADQQKALKNFYAEIGKKYYSEHAEDAGEEYKAYFEKVEACLSTIEDLKKKKSDGKPVVYCQACGAENSESAVYCSHCGTKIIHVSESEPQDAEWEEVKDAQYRACEPGDFAEQEETEAPGQDTQQQDV